jgi:hypothetical protein
MKNEKIKEALGRIGKATLPAMMLLGMAWNGNAAAMTSMELELRAKETEQKQQSTVEIVDNENYEATLAQFTWSDTCTTCEGGCGGCTNVCTGCTGCSITCQGGPGQLY